MSDGPEWFAPKRYGFGSGLPISWQGWAVSFAYAASVIATAYLFKFRPLAIVAVIVPLTAALLVIVARTTRGGWRWRWGDKD